MISLREDCAGAGVSQFEHEIHGIFSEDGKLSLASNFEYRPEQQQMACAVARTLEQAGHLVVEAGTGVGKSLAYLIPAVLHAIRSKRKWYKVLFRCDVTSDARSVAAFEFKLGAPVPPGEWEEHGLSLE